MGKGSNFHNGEKQCLLLVYVSDIYSRYVKLYNIDLDEDDLHPRPDDMDEPEIIK